MSHVLIVDDSVIERHLVKRLIESYRDWTFQLAGDGNEALEMCAARRPDVVLSDFKMPGMNGLELIARLRQDFPGLPVVIMTGQGNEELAVAALQQGAAHYIPKRFLARDLIEIIGRVLAASQSQESRRRLLDSLVRDELEFLLANDRSLVPAAVQHLQACGTRMGVFAEADCLHVGVALEEALVNAIVHGNLEVNSKLRDEQDGAYEKLIRLRAEKEPYGCRRVRVAAEFTNERARFTIGDEGKGFDPASIPDPTDPESMSRAHGRGLLLMRCFMDEVVYNETGNQVTLVKRRQSASRGAAIPQQAGMACSVGE